MALDGVWMLDLASQEEVSSSQEEEPMSTPAAIFNWSAGGSAGDMSYTVGAWNNNNSTTGSHQCLQDDAGDFACDGAVSGTNLTTGGHAAADVPKSQPIAAAGKFYFVTGSGTATATTTAVTSLGNVTGMGCLP